MSLRVGVASIPMPPFINACLLNDSQSTQQCPLPGLWYEKAWTVLKPFQPRLDIVPLTVLGGVMAVSSLTNQTWRGQYALMLQGRLDTTVTCEFPTTAMMDEFDVSFGLRYTQPVAVLRRLRPSHMHHAQLLSRMFTSSLWFVLFNLTWIVFGVAYLLIANRASDNDEPTVGDLAFRFFRSLVPHQDQNSVHLRSNSKRASLLLLAFSVTIQAVFLSLYTNLLLVSLLHPVQVDLIRTSDDLLQNLQSGQLRLIDVYNWIELYAQRNPNNDQAQALGSAVRRHGMQLLRSESQVVQRVASGNVVFIRDKIVVHHLLRVNHLCDVDLQFFDVSYLSLGQCGLVFNKHARRPNNNNSSSSESLLSAVNREVIFARARLHEIEQKYQFHYSRGCPPDDRLLRKSNPSLVVQSLNLAQMTGAFLLLIIGHVFSFLLFTVESRGRLNAWFNSVKNFRPTPKIDDKTSNHFHLYRD